MTQTDTIQVDMTEVTSDSRVASDSELDGGPQAHSPERFCVVTRTVRPVAELIRFVLGPDGEAVPDLKNKLPGRGVWVTASQGTLDDAIKRKVFARGFKRDVRIPSDLLDRTRQLLERSALDALAIAGKAGSVAAGYAKVETALAHGRVVILLHAVEAAPDGVGKLASAVRHSPSAGSVTVMQCLTSAQLDLALGRPNVIHAALLAGPSNDTVLARLRRLEQFRTGNLAQKAGRAVPS
jgi:predicted RNA-binding protein YlxR (DUF448 family)